VRGRSFHLSAPTYQLMRVDVVRWVVVVGVVGVVALCLAGWLFLFPVGASSESLYVDGFSAALSNWSTHTGHTPWLNNDATHSITAFTDHVVDSAYGFADTAVSDFATITSIKLMGMVKSNNEAHYVALLLYGSGWSISYDAWGDGSGTYASFESGELKATISSVARINECLMNTTKHGATTGTLSLQKVYLYVAYGVSNYTLVTAVSPSGYGVVSPSGTNSYNANSNVSVSGTANDGYQLSYWLRNSSVVGTNGTSPYVCNMTSNWNVTVVFVRVNVTLSCYAVGSGSVVPSGSYFEYDNVSVVGSASAGWGLGYWLRNGSLVGVNGSSPYVLNMTASFNVTCVFARLNVTLATYCSPVGWGVVDASGSYFMYNNVSVTASVYGGYQFGSWLLNGTGWGSVNPLALNMSANFNLTGCFDVKNFTLSTFAGVGGSVLPLGGVYQEFVNVSVSAVADSGFGFGGWLLNGSDVGSVNPYLLNMTGCWNMTATFSRLEVSLFVYASPSNCSVTPDGYSSRFMFDNVTVSAVPDVGFVFGYWLRNGTFLSNDLSVEVNMTDNLVLCAVVAEVPVPDFSLFAGLGSLMAVSCLGGLFAVEKRRKGS